MRPEAQTIIRASPANCCVVACLCVSRHVIDAPAGIAKFGIDNDLMFSEAELIEPAKLNPGFQKWLTSKFAGT